MKKPLISIIIPYFQKRDFIKKTIKSVLSQTYKNYEVILVYDDVNKKDLTFIYDIFKKIKKKKIIINKKNIGVGKSRNKGIKYAKGSYIAFLDADDIWKKNKLSYQIDIFEKKNVDLVYSEYSTIDELDNVLLKKKISAQINYSKLLKSCEIGLSTVLIKSKILKKNNFPNLNTQEDFALWLKLLRLNYKFYPLKKDLSYWRNVRNSLSSNTIQKIIDAFVLFYRYENMNFLFSIFSVLVLSFNKIKLKLIQKN